ncbi:MAG: hypothetical protein H3C54_01675 [Taibaiella sp.]|nr:hypothetical protein [Taibaiella sp.]
MVFARECYMRKTYLVIVSLLIISCGKTRPGTPADSTPYCTFNCAKGMASLVIPDYSGRVSDTIVIRYFAKEQHFDILLDTVVRIYTYNIHGTAYYKNVFSTTYNYEIYDIASGRLYRIWDIIDDGKATASLPCNAHPKYGAACTTAITQITVDSVTLNLNSFSEVMLPR